MLGTSISGRYINVQPVTSFEGVGDGILNHLFRIGSIETYNHFDACGDD